jgi:glycosyltransferase involved in cell wall biosynthesis
MSRLRILLAIDDASIGGGQMHVLLLAKYLHADNFEVEIATEPTGWLVEEARKLDLKVHSIAISNRINQQAFKEIRQLLFDRQFDLIHTHGGTAGFWLRSIALTLIKRPALVHTYHGLHYLNIPDRGLNAIPQLLKKVIFQTIDRLLSRYTNWLICVCQSDLHEAIVAGLADLSKSSIVTNGIEIDRFATSLDRYLARSKFEIAQTEFIFGNVGRLHEQKGHKFLLHAFAKISDPARLLIIGDGDLHEELSTLADELQINDRVTFLGARTDVSDFLSAIDTFVLPSLWEGQPIALLEALASGKPCIASNVNGIPEIITNGINGYLVTPQDIDALTTAMKLAIDRPDLLMQLNELGQIEIPPQFLASHMASEIAKIYCINSLKI